MILDHTNIGADTIFSLLSQILVEIMSLNHFSLMAAVFIKIQVFNFRNRPGAWFYMNLHTKLYIWAEFSVSITF